MWYAHDLEESYKIRVKTNKKINTNIELTDLEHILIKFASYIDKRNMDLVDQEFVDPRRIEKLAKEFTFRLACEK